MSTPGSLPGHDPAGPRERQQGSSPIMAAVVYVQEIQETEVHVVPSTSKGRNCSMNKASTSSSSTAPASRKLGKKRGRAGCSKSLMALKDRRRLKAKSVNRKVKKVQLRRKIRARVDREFDLEIEEYEKEFRSLKAERRAALEDGAYCIDQVENLTRTARELREQAERRQTRELAVLLSHLIPALAASPSGY